MATQQQIDNTIQTIENAEAAGSITNDMVGQVLNHLNTGYKNVKDNLSDISTEKTERKNADIEINKTIASLKEELADYPFTVTADRSVPSVKWLLTRLRAVVLSAEVVEHTNQSMYHYDLAYIFRASESYIANSNEPEFLKQYYNALMIGRWPRNNANAEPEFVLVRDYVDLIKAGQSKFWISYDWDDTTIRMLIDASALPTDTALSFSNQPSSDLRKLAFISDLCYSYEHVEDIEPVEPNPGNDDNDVSVMSDKQIAKVVNGELFIGYKYDANNDITIWFKECMNNNIMTFYRVGLATNASHTPALNPERDIDVTLNSARWSDNIGPLCIAHNNIGIWTGANHLYTDNATKTAKTISSEFRADGRLLSDGDLIMADVITVKVVNNIYDPRVAPTTGATHLSKLLCVETVTYRIERGDIAVTVSHDFAGANAGKISTYYGMQSMFDNESEIFTPQGAYASGWVNRSEVTSFTKANYPDFNRFIERSGDNMQLTMLYPYGIGNHQYLASTEQIFRYSYNDKKSYHFLLKNFDFNSSTRYSWRGLYSWMRWHAEVNTSSGNMQALAYSDCINKKLYVDVTPSCSSAINVPIPPEAYCRELKVKDESQNVSIDNATAGTVRIIGNSTAYSATVEYGTIIPQAQDIESDEHKLFNDLWTSEHDCLYDPDNAPDGEHPYYCNRLWLTYKEAIVVYNTPRLTYNNIAGFTALANNPKTIILASHSTNGLTVDMPSGFRSVSLQSIRISTGEYVVSAANISYAFAACNQLRYILGVFNFNTPIRTNVTGAFLSCSKLEEVRIKNLTTDISFAHSPLISLESLQYIVDNATNTTAITITVHATTYDKLINGNSEWCELVDTAAAKNIQFATA